MMHKSIIAMGSNIDPEYHIPYALKAIDEKFTIVKMSQFIYTKALLYEDQADFLNGSVLVESELTAEQLIKELKAIEDEMKRDRTTPKNGPRNIDLDLIVYNNEIIDEDVYERDFLKDSIKELQPEVLKKT